jgi:hypothetical protein
LEPIRISFPEVHHRIEFGAGWPLGRELGLRDVRARLGVVEDAVSLPPVLIVILIPPVAVIFVVFVGI